MIIKGNLRGSPKNLARHLQKQDNERVQVLEYGNGGSDLSQSLEEMDLLASDRSSKTLYHLQLNPSQDERISFEQLAEALGELEAELGLEGHARAVVLHEKKGREHFHIVWSRAHPESLQLNHFHQNYIKHEAVSRRLEERFNHRPTPGAFTGREMKPDTRRQNRRRENRYADDRRRSKLSHKEAQLQDRTKIPKARVYQDIRESYSAQDPHKAFEDRGLVLARGDKRNVVVAVDHRGGVHSVSRATKKKAGEVAAKFDLDKLPSIKDAKAKAKSLDPTPKPGAGREVFKQALQASVNGSEAITKTGLKNLANIPVTPRAFFKQTLKKASEEALAGSASTFAPKPKFKPKSDDKAGEKS